MVTAINTETSTQALVSKGDHHLAADTAPPKGEGRGFRPHELLEAALASCMAITVRLVAKERGIALSQVSVAIELDRDDPAEAVFRSNIEFDQEISASDLQVLLAAASKCPVSKTLSKKIIFEQSAEQA